MAKDPMATDTEGAVHFLHNRSVLRPEDVFSDPAGETVFLPPAGDLSPYLRPGSSEVVPRVFWPDFRS